MPYTPAVTPPTADRIPILQIRAFKEARGLDHGWVGPEHFLLALLVKPSVATDVLEGLGMTSDGLAEHLRTRRRDPDWPELRYDSEKGLAGPNPAGHALVGWARGVATAWGSSEPQPEHWLVAMVYDHGPVPGVMHVLGITQEAVLHELRARGVRLPDVDPPWYKPWRGHRGAEVTPAELDPVLGILLERHPPGSEWRWGFNWLPGEPKRAQVVSEDGIDLSAIVTEVKAQGASEQSP